MLFINAATIITGALVLFGLALIVYALCRSRANQTRGTALDEQPLDDGITGGGLLGGG